MLKKGKSISISGTCVVADGTENEKVIATMNVNIEDNAGINRNCYISSTAEYLANKGQVDADMAEFDAYVDALISGEE